MKIKHGSMYLCCTWFVLAFMGCSGGQAGTATAATDPTPPVTDAIALPVEEVEFDLSAANHVLPQDVLQQVTFFVGGGTGTCAEFSDLHHPAISHDPTDEELMVTTYFLTCGWEEDEVLQLTIVYPDGRLTQQEQKAGGGIGDLNFQPGLTDPVGIYTFVFAGKAGVLVSNAYFRNPDGPRLLHLDDQHILLFGFSPQETVRLFSYESDENGWYGTFAGWGEYQVDQAGLLKLKLSSKPGVLVAVGPQSGEVPSLRTGFFGGAYKPFKEMVLREPGNTTSTHYLQCSAEMALRSRLQSRTKIKIPSGNTFVYANPRRDARRIALLPPGTELVLGGVPYCSGKQIWWKVTYKPYQFAGYLLEYDGRSYFLEPQP